MVLLDFEVPSGYVYQSWNYVSKKVKFWCLSGCDCYAVSPYPTQQPSISVQRVDQTGNGALLYIDEVAI